MDYPISTMGKTFLFLVSLGTLACQPSIPASEKVVASFHQVSDSAQILGRDMISTPLPEFATSWNPTLNLLVFNRTSADRKQIHIFYSSFQDGQWVKPQQVPFSDTTHQDIDPFFFGNRLFFSSDRTEVPGSAKEELDLYYSDYQNGQWTDPQPLPSSINKPNTEIFLTATQKGEAYYSVFQTGTRNAHLMQADLTNLAAAPKVVSFDEDSARLTNPAIAPDGSFLILVTGNLPGFGSADLYVSFPDTESGIWSKPINLGPIVNTEYVEFAPGISPDGNYLFFSSERPGVVADRTEGGRRPGDLYVVRLPPLIQQARKQLEK